MKRVQILIAVAVAVFILALFFCLHCAVNDENRLIARVDNEPTELLKNVDNTDATLISSFPPIDSLFLDYCTHEELFTDVNNSPLIAYIYPSKDTLIVAIWAEYNLGFFLQEEKNQLLAVYELNGIVKPYRNITRYIPLKKEIILVNIRDTRKKPLK